MRGRLIAAVVAGLLALAGAAGWAPPALTGEARALTNCDTNTAAMDGTENQVFTLVNNERAAAGFGALSASPSLARAAAWKSEDRASSFGAGLSHTDSLGRLPSARGKDCGYASWVGENIAYGYPTAASVVDAWMGSAGHRANILNGSYVVAAVGYSAGAWTLDFGTVSDGGAAPNPPATDTPVAIQTPPPAVDTSTPTVPTQIPASPPTIQPEASVPGGQIVMELRAGVNLVTYAGEPKPANEALASLGSLVERLWSWDGDTGQWDAWVPGGELSRTLLTGQAYFILLRADATWAY